MILLSCKLKEQIINKTKEIEAISDGRTIGKISHKYHKNGCSTVIVVNTENKIQVLMPINIIEPLLDIDGLEVSFTYHPSKKVQVKDCIFGIPVIMSELRKLK